MTVVSLYSIFWEQKIKATHVDYWRAGASQCISLCIRRCSAVYKQLLRDLHVQCIIIGPSTLSRLGDLTFTSMASDWKLRTETIKY